MTHLFKTNNDGFTLIELLIGIAITIVLSMGILTVFERQQDAQRAQQKVTEMQQDLRAAMYFMTNEIRMAGYDPSGTAGAGITVAGDGSSAASPLVFTLLADSDGEDNAEVDDDSPPDGLVDSTDDGTDETGELRYFAFYLYDSTIDSDNDVDELCRRNGARPDRIANNIQTLRFEYLDADGLVTATLQDIRSVRITITAMPEPPLPPGINNRTLTTVVQCRNLGI